MTGWPWFEQNRQSQSGLTGPWPSVWLADRLGICVVLDTWVEDGEREWGLFVLASPRNPKPVGGPLPAYLRRRPWRVRLVQFLGVRAGD